MAEHNKNVVFDYPVTFDGQQVTQVTVRVPRLKDQKKSQSYGTSEAEQEQFLFHLLTGRPLEFFDELAMSDYLKIQQVVIDFLGKSPVQRK